MSQAAGGKRRAAVREHDREGARRDTAGARHNCALLSLATGLFSLTCLERCLLRVFRPRFLFLLHDLTEVELR